MGAFMESSMNLWATSAETIWTSCEGIPSGFLSMILPSLLGCMLRGLGTAGLLTAARMSNLFSAVAIVISMPAHPKDRQEFDGFMIFASLEKMSKIYANTASMSRKEQICTSRKPSADGRNAEKQDKCACTLTLTIPSALDKSVTTFSYLVRKCYARSVVLKFVRQRVFTASMSNVKSEQESKRNDFVGIPRHRERLGDDTSAIVFHNIRSNSDLHERWFLR